jgi:hypothetical protein
LSAADFPEDFWATSSESALDAINRIRRLVGSLVIRPEFDSSCEISSCQPTPQYRSGHSLDTGLPALVSWPYDAVLYFSNVVEQTVCRNSICV